MEKEGLLSELKAKIGDPNVASKFSNLSERSVSEYVDKIHPTLGADFEPTDEFYATHLGILETFAGNIRAVASSAVENYKKQNKPNPDKQDKVKEVETKTVDKSDDVMQKLLDRLDKIETDKANEAKQAIQKANIKSAKVKLEADGADDSAILDIAVKLTSLNGDESIEDIATKVKEEYNKQYTALRGDGYSPSGGSGGVKDSNFSSYIEKKKKEGKLPNNDKK